MDVTEVILRDHAWFRRQFIALYDLYDDSAPDVAAISALWEPLAARLDVHAAGEEEIFYPQLLARGEDDPEDETLDAIGDHNDIRDGVHDAARHQVASEQWWAAVGRTREANDDHMGEEEREGLSDFRRNAPIGLREALGRQYSEFMAEHPTTEGLPIREVAASAVRVVNTAAVLRSRGRGSRRTGRGSRGTETSGSGSRDTATQTVLICRTTPCFSAPDE